MSVLCSCPRSALWQDVRHRCMESPMMPTALVSYTVTGTAFTTLENLYSTFCEFRHWSLVPWDLFSSHLCSQWFSPFLDTREEVAITVVGVYTGFGFWATASILLLHSTRNLRRPCERVYSCWLDTIILWPLLPPSSTYEALVIYLQLR